MLAPDVPAVAAYLGQYSSWNDGELETALAAESANQARRCRVPGPGQEWPPDLAEALCRRVAHNLGLRRLPLGIQSNIADAAVSTVRVGGLDAEVRRLEAPYRRASVG